MRRFLTVALAAAAVLVPSAQALPALDAGGTQLSDATGIPYLSHGQGVPSDAFGQAAPQMRYGTPVEYLAADVAVTGVRSDVLDRFVANDRAHAARTALVRADGPDGFVPADTRLAAASSPGDTGITVDWTALGIGMGLGFLLAALLVGAARVTRRGGVASA